MDDEPMWAADRVVALTPGSAITIPETANEFAIKGNHLTLVKGNQFDGRTKIDPHKHIHEFLIICDMFKYRDTENEAVRLMMFPLSLTREAKTWLEEINQGTIKTWDELRTAFISRFFPRALFDRLLGEIRAFSQRSSNSDTDKIMDRMDAITIKMDAQYKELQSRAKKPTPDLDDHDIPMSREEEAKFMQTFQLISNKHTIEQISAAFLSDESSAMIQNKVPPKIGDPGSFLIPCNFKTFSCNALADLAASINLMPYSLYAKLSFETLKPTKMSVRLADRSFQYPVGIVENMLVEVVTRVKQKQLNLRIKTERMIFNIDSAMKHSYSNDDTCFSIDVIDEILEEDFDALLDEGSKILHSIEGTLLEEEIFSEFDEFMAMTADEDSESESDTEEPPFEKITINTDYKIKTSLEEPPTDLELKPLPDNLEYVFLEEPSFLPVIISSKLSAQNKSKLHKIQLLDDKKPVVKKEIVKLLVTGIIYPITDSPSVSPIHCIPKKGGIIVVTNKNDELVPKRTITGWRVCIDYRKLNEATAKDHFPLLFMDQMLERLAENKYFCFLDGFYGYFQIPIDPMDQEKTTITCPFGTYAYRRMPFGLCNAPSTFQRCMLAIFHDMIEESVEVFMDAFSVFRDSFDKCLNNLDKMLQHCKDAHLVLN
ncbi:reverse transcriptase domain-containing protein [Tanacetum coccineum]